MDVGLDGTFVPLLVSGRPASLHLRTTGAIVRIRNSIVVSLGKYPISIMAHAWGNYDDFL